MGFLGIPLPVTKEKIQQAAEIFLEDVKEAVIIRSGAMGAYTLRRNNPAGTWIDAFWTANDSSKIMDVTGAGNSFLGGLAAGLVKTGGDLIEAVLYASVSASFTIEQSGLPRITREGIAGETEEWNGDTPLRRLTALQQRMKPT